MQHFTDVVEALGITTQSVASYLPFWIIEYPIEFCSYVSKKREKTAIIQKVTYDVNLFFLNKKRNTFWVKGKRGKDCIMCGLRCYI